MDVGAPSKAAVCLFGRLHQVLVNVDRFQGWFTCALGLSEFGLLMGKKFDPLSGKRDPENFQRIRYIFATFSSIIDAFTHFFS